MPPRDLRWRAPPWPPSSGLERPPGTPSGAFTRLVASAMAAGKGASGFPFDPTSPKGAGSLVAVPYSVRAVPARRPSADRRRSGASSSRRLIRPPWILASPAIREVERDQATI
jgi:hypothetical protein